MSQPITCIITDDEPYARKGLQAYVDRTGFLELKGQCEDAMELGEMLKQNDVDLLFLDIRMPHLSGVDFLRSLKNPPKVIFTTAFKEFAIEGFELDVLDYMLKPISYERFLKAAYKTKDYFDLKRSAELPAYLFVKSEGKLEKVVFDDILFLEGLENYIIIQTIAKKIIIHSTLKAVIEKLPKQQFMQTHKSYVVALGKVSTIAGNTMHIGTYQVPIGRQLREDVMNRIIGNR